MPGKGMDAPPRSLSRRHEQKMELQALRAGALEVCRFAYRIAATAYVSGEIGVNHTWRRLGIPLLGLICCFGKVLLAIMFLDG